MKHGIWTKEELEATKKDKWLATQLMNQVTFSKEAIKYYPYAQRRTYLCDWDDEPEPVKIYATDEKMLLKWVDANCTRRPDMIHQVITQYRPVNLNKGVEV